MRVKSKTSVNARASISLRLDALSCVKARMTASMVVGFTLNALQTSFRCLKSRSTSWISGTARTASNAVASTRPLPPSRNHQKWPKITMIPLGLQLPRKIMKSHKPSINNKIILQIVATRVINNSLNHLQPLLNSHRISNNMRYKTNSNNHPRCHSSKLKLLPKLSSINS